MRAMTLLALVAVGCGSTAGGGSDGNVTPADMAAAGPIVKLRNPAATLDTSSGIVNIQFVVDDTAYPTRSIASIEGVSMLWPGGSTDVTFHCTQAPWVVAAELTDVIHVSVGADGSAMTLVTLPCAGPFFNPPAAPVNGSILVEVDGTLDDASSFKAETAATP